MFPLGTCVTGNYPANQHVGGIERDLTKPDESRARLDRRSGRVAATAVPCNYRSRTQLRCLSGRKLVAHSWPKRRIDD